MSANWKVAADNNSGDWYHVFYAHGSIPKITPLQPNQPPLFQHSDLRMQIAPDPGHGLVGLLGEAPKDALRGASRPVRDYYRSTMPEAMERLGPMRSRFLFIAGLVFPNFGWVPGSHTTRQYHPRGPDKMEVWSYCLVDAEAPQEIKDAMRQDYVQRLVLVACSSKTTARIGARSVPRAAAAWRVRSSLATTWGWGTSAATPSCRGRLGTPPPS